MYSILCTLCTLPTPTALKTSSRIHATSYEKRRTSTPNKMSSSLVRLHNCVLCANQSLWNWQGAVESTTHEGCGIMLWHHVVASCLKIWSSRRGRCGAVPGHEEKRIRTYPGELSSSDVAQYRLQELASQYLIKLTCWLFCS